MEAQIKPEYSLSKSGLLSKDEKREERKERGKNCKMKILKEVRK